MTFRFLIPGKCREQYLKEGFDEYLKRLSKYGKVTLTYLPEENISVVNEANVQRALKAEAQRALKQIKEDDVLFLVDIHGKRYSTETFAKAIKEKSAINGNFVFLFGSSYGLDDALRKRADVAFSLSDMTFTHYMALLIVLEQVYRSMKIIRGETYDK